MMGPISWAIMPVRRYADFTGRSTRTELAFFYLLTMLLGVVLSEFALFAFGSEGRGWANLAYTLVLACPWFALGARRLHDTGRSGWWLLLALPGVPLGIWDALRRLNDPFAASVQSSLPGFVMIPLVVFVLALWVLLLWKDEEGPNRYGPNPRYDTAEASA